MDYLVVGDVVLATLEHDGDRFEFSSYAWPAPEIPGAALVGQRPDYLFVVTCTFPTIKEAEAFQQARIVSHECEDRRFRPERSDVGQVYAIHERHQGRRGHDHVVWDSMLEMARHVRHRGVCKSCRKKQWQVDDGYPLEGLALSGCRCHRSLFP